MSGIFRCGKKQSTANEELFLCLYVHRLNEQISPFQGRNILRLKNAEQGFRYDKYNDMQQLQKQEEKVLPLNRETRGSDCNPTVL